MAGVSGYLAGRKRNADQVPSIDTWRTGCTPRPASAATKPVTVEICPELAALRVADPCQAIGARRSGSRCHHFWQDQARWCVQYRHRLPGLELQLAADVHALSMSLPCRRRQSPRERRRPASRGYACVVNRIRTPLPAPTRRHAELRT